MAADDALAQGVPQYRGLKTAVIVMGILLVVGFILVFSTIIYRTVNLGDDEGAPGVATTAKGYDRAIALPAGAQVQRVTPDSDRLLVEVVQADGVRMLIVLDARRGREIGRFRLSTQ